ncbi:MAG: GPW/gp25 family protein [Flavobacteriaceae bacterium]|nr:GPW/gp25 family protein [Flavobacteriaceae bacterium]
MNNKFYTLPLKAINLITNAEHKKCSINESIAHYIHLITTSYFGECSFDDSFGCSIWEIDFDNLKSITTVKEAIVESLSTSLKKHEKRLVNVKINVNVKQQEIKGNRMKKKVDILVEGKVKKTNEDFSYIEYFYIGPLSY